MLQARLTGSLVLLAQPRNGKGVGDRMLSKASHKVIQIATCSVQMAESTQTGKLLWSPALCSTFCAC